MHFIFRFLHVLISTTSASLNSCPRQRLRRQQRGLNADELKVFALFTAGKLIILVYSL